VKLVEVICKLLFSVCFTYLNIQSYILVVSIFAVVIVVSSLQCFDAVGWVAGRASGL